ncbi:pre-rRNA-processing protein TSR2 homolog [Phalaenopsis equestris]|uniref:pre-rRNA-processing protein TSR2 homolog n=1 Tax=Phalaenopsis equestris TaxID=78828 RepID=UPI0009E45969|nr:pre-rRNA-processing protein TSR2 homolog [Phalaenopsis equestris]
MDSSNGILSREAAQFLEEGIFLVLSRWTALQMAVENEWGGRESRRKSEELASAIFSWFTQSKEPLYIDDLEKLLDENMESSFNTEIDDGSVEEVAEQLMVIHEDLLGGNFASIADLRKAAPATASVSQSRKVEESSDDEGSDMIVDESPQAESLGDNKTEEIQVDDEGWRVVPPRRNRGKRLGFVTL